MAKTAPSFEQARDELAAIVMKLESGAIPLDESLALWRKGEELAQLCEELLDAASIATHDDEEDTDDDEEDATE